MHCVVADSSFFIFFLDEINCPKQLCCILDLYDVCIGKKIREEITSHLASNGDVESGLNDMSLNVDFQTLLEQYEKSFLKVFPEMTKWEAKGEFEAIGISYLMKEMGTLRYLIIDDKKAYLFVNNQLNFIKSNLTRTFGFLMNGLMKDGLISTELLQEIIKKTDEKILLGHQPFYIDKSIWEKEIKPNLFKSMEGNNG